MNVSKSSIYRTEWSKRAIFDFVFWMNSPRVNQMDRDFSALQIASYLIQKLQFFTKKTHIFWVPTMMRKRKRIILMQWYNSIKHNLNYLRLESTRVLHINFQESVHLPSVNESSVFANLNILCNLRITDFWYLELYGQFWKIYSSHFHSVHVDIVMTSPFQTLLALVFCSTFAGSCAFMIILPLQSIPYLNLPFFPNRILLIFEIETFDIFHQAKWSHK